MIQVKLSDWIGGWLQGRSPLIYKPQIHSDFTLTTEQTFMWSIYFSFHTTKTAIFDEPNSLWTSENDLFSLCLFLMYMSTLNTIF